MANSDTHREMHDLFNGRDFDAVAKRVTDDFRYVDRGRGIEVLGGDGFKAYLGGWTATMSNARVTDARYIDGGTTSVALFTGRGTHDGALGPIPPSGNDIAFPLCEVFTYDGDGNVTSGELYYDQTAVIAQATPESPRLASSNVADGERRAFEHGEMRVTTAGGVTLGRAEFKPGWRWSNDVKPLAGTSSCQVAHNGYIISGRLHVRMDDGTEAECGPGDLFVIAPGHDAWVVGDETCVALDWTGGTNYALPT